ncbi:hypothetical protein L2E82_52209 [Cichorium intybus]|nr:hypothetical protein L2E82_52209 [Cichorium intybus]
MAAPAKEANLWEERFEEGLTDAVQRFTESISFDKAHHRLSLYVCLYMYTYQRIANQQINRVRASICSSCDDCSTQQDLEQIHQHQSKSLKPKQSNKIQRERDDELKLQVTRSMQH